MWRPLLHPIRSHTVTRHTATKQPHPIQEHQRTLQTTNTQTVDRQLTLSYHGLPERHAVVHPPTGGLNPTSTNRNIPSPIHMPVDHQPHRLYFIRT
ncbi:hypothetical protein AVEN_201668-1 [Araneus ventricosus]|uniref:Uncharacterized protein n=1 Tax=Araneus ventricosus TaxID=182803 RepID=A0A4Y2PFM6_ARAVE|nr:hypothetical protein AVEN_63960-1 [Araneus ventricosus]GBN49300.1 hypothetical protein AVEN_201668-1 [Araneus ventricosus]